MSQTSVSCFAAGVLVVEDGNAAPPVYLMPGGTPGSDREADELKPNATRRDRRIELPSLGDYFDTCATDSEHVAIVKAVRRLGDEATFDAIEAQAEYPFDGRAMLTALRSALPPVPDGTVFSARRDSVQRRTGQCSAPVGIEASTYDLEPLTSSSGEPQTGGTSHGESRAHEDDDSGYESKSSHVTRRTWNSDGFTNLYYYADDAIHEQLVALVQKLEASWIMS